MVVSEALNCPLLLVTRKETTSFTLVFSTDTISSLVQLVANTAAITIAAKEKTFFIK
jgi:hypothetical protein